MNDERREADGKEKGDSDNRSDGRTTPGGSWRNGRENETGTKTVSESLD
jgi:hypothetical protein